MTVNLLKMKCATPRCWHFRISSGSSIYCQCCSYGKCDRFTSFQKAEYRRQLAEKKKGDAIIASKRQRPGLIIDEGGKP